ncbi:MAG: TMEM175 family protein [Bacteroidia bacterium]
MNPKLNEEKQKFQVDRIAFFSDAVFAIAITLMIIEVKPPHLEAEANNAAAIEGLLHVLPMFIGVVISFVFIGIFWFRHH